MTLSVETLGEEGLRELENGLRDLAAEGGKAAPQFERLANEVNKLAQQGDTINAFQQLSTATEALGAAYTEISGKVAAAKAELDEIAGAYAKNAASVKDLADKERDARVARDSARDSLKLLKIELAEGKVAQEAYDAEQLKARRAIVETGAAYRTAKDNLADANKALNESKAGLSDAQKEYDNLAKAAGRAGTAFEASGKSLEIISAKAKELGVETNNVAATQTELATALDRVTTEADQLQAAIADVAESDRLLAIEQRTLAQLAERGADALQAEVAAQRDAVRSNQAYEESMRQAAQAQRDFTAGLDSLDASGVALKTAKERVDALTAAEQRLAAQNAFEEQAQQAQQLANSAARLRDLELAFERAEIQARALADSAVTGATRINQAFSNLGVRSIEEIRNEIIATRSDLVTMAAVAEQSGNKLTGAFTAGQAKIALLEREIRQLNGTLTLADKASALFANSLGQIAAGNVIADGIGYLVNKVKEAAVAFVDITIKTEQARRGLTAIYKDAALASSQFNFLRKTADDAGVAVGGIQQSFVKFSAATRSANIPIKVTNDLFAAVTRAGASLGLTTEEVGGTLDALGQTASKGVVSMEELRQQLGDRLPGALSLTAKGLGITDAQLVKLVESGQLLAEDFFPALTKGLKDLAGDTDTLAGSIGRFKNLLNETSIAAADTGGLDVLKGALASLQAVLGFIGVAAVSTFALVATAGKQLGTIMAAVVNKDFANLSDALDDIANAQLASTEKLVLAYRKSIGLVDDDTENQKKNLEVKKQIAPISATAASAIYDQFVSTEKALQATKELTGSELGLSNSLIALNVRFAESAKLQENNVKVAEQHAKAEALRAKTLLETSKLSADATTIQLASAEAANINAEAASKVASQMIAQANATKENLAQQIALLATEGEISAGRQQKLAEQEKTLALQTEEANKARETRDNLIALAEAQNLHTKTLQDNSGKLQQYNDQLSASATRQAELRAEVARQEALFRALGAAYVAGTITAEQYDRAEIALKESKRLYNLEISNGVKLEKLANDAAADTVRNLALQSAAQTAGLRIQVASNQAAIASYNALAAQSRAIGDVVTATEFEIAAKNRQIQIIEITNKIRAIELKYEQQMLETELKATKGTDDLSAAKRIELQLRIDLLKIKQLENDASLEQVRALEAEIFSMRNGLNVRQQSSQGISSDTDVRTGNAASIERQIDAINRLADAEFKYSKVKSGFGNDQALKSKSDSGTFVDTFGVQRNKTDGAPTGTFTNTVPIDQATALAEKQKRGFITADDKALAEAGLAQAKTALQYISNMAKNSPGAVSNAAIQDAQRLYQSAVSALNTIQGLTQASSATGKKTAAGTVNSTAAPSPAPQATNVNDDAFYLTTYGMTKAQYQKKVADATKAQAGPGATQLEDGSYIPAEKAASYFGGTPVNITINGTTKTFNAASQTDANALADILKLLEQDSKR